MKPAAPASPSGPAPGADRPDAGAVSPPADSTRFRRLLELSSDWYWEQDEHFRFKDVGNLSETHLRAGPAAYVGSTRWDNPNTNLTPAQWAAHRAMLEAHLPFRDFEYGRISRDGVLRYMSVSGEPVFDEAGRFKGYCGIAKDVTAHKLADADRAQLQQLLNSVIEQMPAAVQLHSVRDDFRVVMWNKSAEQLYGVPRREAIGRTMHDLWPGTVADRMHATDQELVEKGGTQDLPDRTMLSRSTGSIRVHMRKVLLRDAAGNPGHILVVADDITERKAREEALQRLHVAMDATTDGIYLVDRATMRFLYVNAATTRMLGRSHEEVMSTGPAGVLGVARADLERTYDALIASGAPGAPLVLQRRRPDGALTWVELRRHAKHTGQGWMIITVARDISAGKQTEAARAALELELRESQKMEAIGTLAGGIAHDFNNIISAILGNVELARQDVVNPRALESLEEIRKAGFRARSMVQQILTFSRRQPTKRVPVSLSEIIEESVRLLRATLPAHISITSQCDAQTPDVLADATQLHQVLINLGTNAAYAIGAHAGHIDIRARPVLLDDAARLASPRLGELRAGRFAHISVSDTGQGMDATTLEHIFEPFFTTKPVGEGTGLGLSVAHGILRTHDGAVVAHGEPGRGSRFDLYLPAVTATPAAIPPAPVAATPAGIGQHVLYVDDDESLLFLTRRMLERRGYRVTAHIVPDAALAAVRADPNAFDLVVTDFNMPGKSGLDVARAIREIRPDLPVAITSGYITDQLRLEAEGAGVRALIFKPNAIEELCDAVQRLILTPGALPGD